MNCKYFAIPLLSLLLVSCRPPAFISTIKFGFTINSNIEKAYEFFNFYKIKHMEITAEMLFFNYQGMNYIVLSKIHNLVDEFIIDIKSYYDTNTTLEKTKKIKKGDSICKVIQYLGYPSRAGDYAWLGFDIDEFNEFHVNFQELDNRDLIVTQTSIGKHSN